ncbi:MAG: hypothetical protein WC399_02475 [Bacilli bacterium]|jgi:hypothetical protein
MNSEHSIPESIKKDWRLPVYLLAVGVMLLLTQFLNFLPAFQVYDATTATVIDDVRGFVAFFGGEASLTYYPLSFGILAQAFMVLAGFACIAFSLLLKKRRTDGKRRFTLIIVSLSLSISAVILLFLSLVQFRDLNDLLSVGLVARYHYGLVLQAIVLLTSVYIQWFFFIKIRHYIK